MVRQLDRAIHDRRVRRHAERIRPLHPEDAPLLADLEQHGICILPVGALGWPSTDELLGQLDALSGELRPAPSAAGNRVSIGWSRMGKATRARDWGLNGRALALAENYIRLPLFYGGTQVRREIPNGERGGVRQWHLDVEDRRVLKLIIYAEDVVAGGGPFEYLPLPETEEVVAKLRYRVGLLDDESLRLAGIPPRASVEVLAPKFTAILVDAGRLLHRAQPPVARDRYTATYCWMSVFGDRDHHPRGQVVDARAFGRSDGPARESRLRTPPRFETPLRPSPDRGSEILD